MNNRSRRMRVVFWTLLAGSQGCYLLLLTGVAPPLHLFIITALIASGLYLGIVAVIRAGGLEDSGTHLAWVIAAGIIFRLTVHWNPPTASDDMYRYVWDGKVQHAGFDPYQYAPADSALASLHTESLPEAINFPNMKTVYPPLAEWFFLFAYVTGGESAPGFKALFLLMECATILLLLPALREAGKPAIASAYYILCPLPVLHLAGDGHVDGLALPFFLLFILFMLKKRTLAGSFCLGLAASVKLLPLMFLPTMVSRRPRVREIPLLMLPPALLAALYLPYLLGVGAPFESLAVYASRWVFNGPAFHLLNPLLGNTQITRMLLAVGFVAWLGVLFIRKRDFTATLYGAVLGYALLTPTLHPWYLTWLAVLLPFHFRWSGAFLVSTVQLSLFTVLAFHQSGLWIETPWILVFEYAPVAILLFREVFLRK